jgi:hypothetical protein
MVVTGAIHRTTKDYTCIFLTVCFTSLIKQNSYFCAWNLENFENSMAREAGL